MIKQIDTFTKPLLKNTAYKILNKYPIESLTVQRPRVDIITSKPIETRDYVNNLLFNHLLKTENKSHFFGQLLEKAKDAGARINIKLPEKNGQLLKDKLEVQITSKKAITDREAVNLFFDIFDGNIFSNTKKFIKKFNLALKSSAIKEEIIINPKKEGMLTGIEDALRTFIEKSHMG